MRVLQSNYKPVHTAITHQPCCTHIIIISAMLRQSGWPSKLHVLWSTAVVTFFVLLLTAIVTFCEQRLWHFVNSNCDNICAFVNSNCDNFCASVNCDIFVLFSTAVVGSFSRSAVNASYESQSPTCNVITGFVIMLTLLFCEYTSNHTNSHSVPRAMS